ncbi:choice-of-anchor D domain-containing protein, partial [Archangium sp.]|uniref:choice-of-anchor D domain-containing protein n=1 Tax=Archangium sp. TaxID=1872627 RepID=UPI002ED77456
MCLGLLASCGPNDSQGAVSEDSRGRTSAHSQVAASLTGSSRVNPTSLVFGAQRVNTTSAAKSMVVTNTGTETLTISSISVNGPFALVGPPSMPMALSPDDSHVFSVAFIPTAEGSATGTLTVTTNDPDRPTLVVALAGTGVMPRLDVSPSPLAFGDVRVGTTVTKTVIVKNVGTGPITFTSLSTEAGSPFELVTPTTVPFTLASNEQVVVTVKFSPTAEGAVTGTLVLGTDDPAIPNVTVALSGSGGKATLSLSSTVLDFGTVRVGTSSARTVTVTNTGSIAATLQSLSGVAAPFSVTGFDLPRTLPAGAAVSFTVNFSPTTSAAVTGRVTVVSDAVNSPHELTLSGTGATAVAELSLPSRPGQTVLDFGEVRVNTSKVETVRLTNKGGVPLTFKQPVLSASSPFSSSGPSTLTLPPGASVDFQVSFKPTEGGIANDTLVVESDATNSPSLLSLTGKGTSSEAKLDRDSIFFGDVRVGSESARLPVRISNTGTARLTVQSLSVVGPFTATSDATLPVELPVGGSTTFSVAFKPSASGAATGSVSILTDANVGSALKVVLQGNGTVSALSLSVAALDFGTQRVRETSGAQPVVFSNVGKAELEISDLLFSDAVFAISPALPLPLKIPAGQSKVVSVTFTPKALGVVSGKLYIISDAFETPAPLELKGKGADGQLSLTPSFLSFGGVEVGTLGTQLAVTLSNTGEYPLTLTEVVKPTEASFSISGLTPGLVLDPGEQRPFTVTFAPTKRGYLADTVVIKSDARLKPSYSLAVSGTGMAPAVELLPKDINFGKSNVGGTTSQGLAIKNVGERDLYVSNISFAEVASGAPGAALDFTTEVLLPLVVKPGESTLVSLKFTPRAVGLRQARVIVYTNDK